MDRHRLYLGIWLATAIGLGLLLGIAEFTRNPLNDPDPAQQRSGMLLPARAYPAAALGDVPRPGQRAIIFFARSLAGQPLFHDLADQSDLSQAADLVVVTVDGSRPTIMEGIRRALADPDSTLAGAYGLDRPNDGGPPIGYVIIDSQGFIRYRTLDPGFMHNTREIRLLLGATP